jgi:hypothetical protein
MAIIRHTQAYKSGQIDVTPVSGPTSHNMQGEYTTDQTVEQNPIRPAPFAGNKNLINLRTIYDAWLAAYRGLAPHGIPSQATAIEPVAAPAPTDITAGTADNPKPFTEPTPETVTDESHASEVRSDADDLNMLAVPVTIVDDSSSADDYWSTYQINVGAGSPTRIVSPQKFRAQVRMANFGNQNVYISETESRGLEGFPLNFVASGAPTSITIATTREIWAVADPAAGTALIPVKVLLTYERRQWS